MTMTETRRFGHSARRLERLMDTLVRGVQDVQSIYIVELLRRNEETAQPDGYPSGASDVVVQASSEDTTTERAALYGLPDEGVDDWRRHHVRDDIDTAVDQFATDLDAAARLIGRMLRTAEFVQNVKDAARGRVSSLAGVCKACGGDVSGSENDRLRNGYCNPCRAAFDRAGKPIDTDRVRFEAQRWLRSHPTCDAADELDYRRRQHVASDGIGSMPPVIPLAGEDQYRRHQLPPAVDPDRETPDRDCPVCGGTTTRHYSSCSVWS